MSYNTTDGGEGYSGKHSEEHIKNRVRSKINNSAYDYILIDKYYNYIVCDSIREIADYLEVTPGVVRHVMHQPIGYSCKKHFIWKHLKTDPIYIEDIKNQIEKALLLRKMKFVETINKYRPVYQEVIKAKIALMTPEERKIMFGRRRKKEN